MGFTKFASLDTHVLEIRGSQTQRRTSSLDKLSEFDDYRTEDNYLYARIRAISSRVNKNHDGWPSIELAGSPEIFEQHTSSEGFTVHAKQGAEYGFSTFVGKPIFVDHHNSDPSKARGVIVDAKFHVDDHKTASLDPYYSSPDVDPEHLPGSWVELLLEVDAKQFPRLAKAIIAGSRDPRQGIDGFSMGCDVEKSVCSICKNSATSPDEFCNHIKLKGMEHKAADGKSRHSYENCYGVKFFEISAVFDPADETALTREVRSSRQSIYHIDPPPEASGNVACPNCVGTGISNPTIHETCPECGGTGAMPGPVMGGDGMYTDRVVKNQMPGIDTTRLGPVHQGSVHLAENPLPQYEQPHAPQQVDTLREEKVCPVCGSSMDEETCDVCNYTEPPEPFQNPDLEKAQETDLKMDKAEEQGQDGIEVGKPDEDQGGPKVENTPRNPAPVAHVTSSMAWQVQTREAGRINTSETPVIPGNGPVSDEPKDTVISDQTKPVTSSVRTASDFIAAAGRNKETTMSNKRVAAEPIPGAENQSGTTRDHDEVQVDVTGVGGVQEATNEEASKADSQVDVEAIGSTGVEGVKADKTTEVEQGTEHSKNIEAIPTKTFPDDNQHDPVTREPFPASEDGVKKSGWEVRALDAGPYPTEEMANGAYGGGAVEGTQPADPIGKPDERVDVLDSTTSPSNNSGPTKTWSGTDGNGVTKQQDPVTTESIAQGESGMHNSHVFTAFKLAELEVELGLLDADRKFDRAAELERTDPNIVQASLNYAQRVKTASRKRTAASRLPVLGRNSAQPKTASVEESKSDESIDPDFVLGA